MKCIESNFCLFCYSAIPCFKGSRYYPQQHMHQAISLHIRKYTKYLIPQSYFSCVDIKKQATVIHCWRSLAIAVFQWIFGRPLKYEAQNQHKLTITKPVGWCVTDFYRIPLSVNLVSAWPTARGWIPLLWYWWLNEFTLVVNENTWYHYYYDFKLYMFLYVFVKLTRYKTITKVKRLW